MLTAKDTALIAAAVVAGLAFWGYGALRDHGGDDVTTSSAETISTPGPAVRAEPGATPTPAGRDAAARSLPMTALEPEPLTRGSRVEHLEATVASLVARVTELETQLAAAAEPTDGEPPAADTARAQRETAGRALTAEALVDAGLDAGVAATIVARESAVAMRRLELRDLASREGWFGTERYFESLTEIEEEAGDLRAELGESAYDRYLYASGEANRVAIGSVIPGSPAEQAGLRSGDVLLSYGEARLFAVDDLLQATTGGERGEYVPIRIERDGSQLDLVLPRGPMGVRLVTSRLDPGRG